MPIGIVEALCKRGLGVSVSYVMAPNFESRASRLLIRHSSGLLVAFIAFGFGSWFSGASSWVGFNLGARGAVLIAVAQASAWVGCVAAVLGLVAWVWRRHRRGLTDVPAWAVLAAFLVLPLGNIFWAIFVDAIAYHYGRDIVRPAFDNAIMYIVLGGLPPMAIAMPLLLSRLSRLHPATTAGQAT